MECGCLLVLLMMRKMEGHVGAMAGWRERGRWCRMGSQDHLRGGWMLLCIIPECFLSMSQVVCADTCSYYSVAVHAFTYVSQTRLSMSERPCACRSVCASNVYVHVGVEGASAK